MKVAFYKGHKRFFDRFIQWWTKSPYSHTEVILEEYVDGKALCGSASFLDGGVRVKLITFKPDNWDFVIVPGVDKAYVKAWYDKNLGKKYDLIGLLGVVSPVRQHGNKYWCSEANAASLGIEESWRYAPSHLYSYAKTVETIYKCRCEEGSEICA
jgi:hypothetical protein